jgi:hypothetical protein
MIPGLVASGVAAGVFEPLSIPWYVAWRAEDATHTGEGTAITAIADASGNGRTPTFPATAPLYRAASINGRPALDSANAQKYATVTFGPLSAPFTFVGVAKITLLASFKAFMGNGTIANAQLLGTAGSNAWRMYAGTGFTNGTATQDVAHLFVGEFNGASSIFTIDGSAVVGNPGINTTLDGLTMCTGASGSSHGSYHVAWASCINRVLTTDEKAGLLAWSRSHYGTP